MDHPRLTDLAPTHATPAPVDQSDWLERLGLDRGHACVCGLQWGDEGKGQIVDHLARRFDLVIRYNGGNNAGHSVHLGSERFALHLVPSGILYPQTLNILANGVVIDPASLLQEIAELRKRGVHVGDNLRISDRAHVVFPYHILEDRLLDLALARAAGDQARIGTTGRGIGPCYADKALRSTAIRMAELLDHDALRQKLRHIVAVKNQLLAALARQCGEDFQPLDADQLARQYADYGQQLAPYICDTTALLHQAIRQGKRLLFEGANAVLLDVDHGTYPYVTSSSCASLGLYPGAGIPGGTLSHMIGVVKAYTSRVGGGPHPTELRDPDPLAQRIRQRGSEFGTTTGRPRRVGWLDLVAVRYSATLSGATALALTGLSVLAGLEKIKVCVGYRYQGRTLDSPPADSRILENLQPQYLDMPGWPDDLENCQRYDQLPESVKNYVRLIEDFVAVPVRLICVGRRRDQILPRP